MTTVSSRTESSALTAANALPAVDKDFVQAATMASSTHIDAAELAHKNTANADVRSCARHMIVAGGGTIDR
ncbi:hypothetical protein SUDANB176_00254 [Streptomyces sp. enrichment culture]|uniref:DUF4142 domain-containing protein n=1 Tax=Streptomyces sp. enrichment culture TaxID=1795815 RepID=UPI003F55A851